MPPLLLTRDGHAVAAARHGLAASSGGMAAALPEALPLSPTIVDRTNMRAETVTS